MAVTAASATPIASATATLFRDRDFDLFKFVLWRESGRGGSFAGHPEGRDGPRSKDSRPS
jgi:hypothetical protein